MEESEEIIASDLAAAIRRLKETGTEFLLTDIATAMTFVNIAETTHNEVTKNRNYENARKAYRAVGRLRERLVIDAAQGEEIDTRLAALKNRLQAAGQNL